MTDPNGAKDLVDAMPAPRLHAYEVSTAVNSVRNNGPELIKPIG